MSDYREDYDVFLSKEEAIDILQELSKWVRVFNPICHPRKMGAVMDMAIKALKGQTADVEPVVHCKDCKWHDNCEGFCHNPVWGDGHANYMPPITDKDSYCSYRERKDGR